mmetsp:Transcript_6431/g.13040  ORF Transcript_6431/g.13040 Transcript_6431/m.13040 type:complete len:227 (-) Transcript_6431:556-1236(-)
MNQQQRLLMPKPQGVHDASCLQQEDQREERRPERQAQLQAASSGATGPRNQLHWAVQGRDQEQEPAGYGCDAIECLHQPLKVLRGRRPCRHYPHEGRDAIHPRHQQQRMQGRLYPCHGRHRNRRGRHQERVHGATVCPRQRQRTSLRVPCHGLHHGHRSRHGLRRGRRSHHDLHHDHRSHRGLHQRRHGHEPTRLRRRRLRRSHHRYRSRRPCRHGDHDDLHGACR